MKQRLSNKDIKALNRDLESLYSVSVFSKKDTLELVDKQYYVRDGSVLLFFYEGVLVPSLHLLRMMSMMPVVVVDQGAIKFIANGADVMRPGVTSIEDFAKGSFVVVIDEVHKQPLAIGKVLYSSDDMRQMKKGKVIQLIHYVGDEIWKFS